MRSARFKFESLLKFRKSRRDLCRQLLVQILADDRDLAARRQGIDEARRQQFEEFRERSVSGDVDIDGLAARRYYAGQLAAAVLQIDHNRRLVAEQLKLCRQALVKADQEVKVLEKLAEKEAAEARQVEDRRARLELEEAWMAAHWTEFTK